MIKWSVKSLPALFVLLALFLGAWTAAPGASVAPQQATAVPSDTATAVASPSGTVTAMPSESATAVPSGTVTAVPSESATVAPSETATAVPTTSTPVARGTQKQVIAYLNSFSLDVSGVSSANASAFDKAFISNALAMNTAELQMLRMGQRRASNSDVRSLTSMMIQMHMKDQALLTKLQGQVGGSATPSLTNVSFLPGTAEYSLGFRTIDLKALFLNKVSNARDGEFDLVYLDQLIGSHGFIVDSAIAYQAAGLMNVPSGGMMLPGAVSVDGSTSGNMGSDVTSGAGGGAASGADVVSGPVTVNPTLQALAVHAAQEASLHKLLATVLRDRLFFHTRTTIIYPVVPTVAPSETPTAVPSVSPTSTETATSVPSATETATSVPSATESATSVSTMTETPGTPAVSETPSATGTSGTTTAP